jgi:proline dehydrogenase
VVFSNRFINPTPDFNDAASAFASKTTRELLIAAVAFGLCQIRPLVKHSEKLLRLLRYVTGDRFTDEILKATLFGHFCAGESGNDIQPAIAKLNKSGIGSILDYAAEDDDNSAHAASGARTTNLILQQNHPNARMYDYESEAQCDRHLETFQQCIQSVSELQKDGFAAIKVTALGNPKLLARMSRSIVEAQNLFAKFDLNGDGFISDDEFARGLSLFFDDLDNIEQWRQRVLQLMPVDITPRENLGKVDYITWSMLLAPSDLPKVTKGLRADGPLALMSLTPEEAELVATMYERGHALAKEAASKGVRLLVDAEQVRFQPAIDNLVLDLQRIYNAKDNTDFPVIYNTYQCYLKDAATRIQTDVERSRRYNYHFGAKLVRGAYMESERALAESLGVPSPIHDTIHETHKCYNDAVEFLLRCSQQNTSIELMCATHNQETIELAIQVMNTIGLDRGSRVTSFAQLYGMKDNLTLQLGKNGYRAYKYVPYGPVKMVMPYLLRRANENSAIAGGARDELAMIVRELRRRLGGAYVSR